MMSYSDNRDDTARRRTSSVVLSLLCYYPTAHFNTTRFLVPQLTVSHTKHCFVAMTSFLAAKRVASDMYLHLLKL